MRTNVSQQLGVLRCRGIIESRGDGATVLYRVKDPRVFELLAVAKDIITSALTETKDLLADLDQLEFTAHAPKAKPK